MTSIRAFLVLALVLVSASAFTPASRTSRIMTLQVLSDPRSEGGLSTSSQQFLANLKNRANDLTDDAKKVVLAKLESKEFQDEVKAAPARAFSAMKGFVESEEVKSASKLAVNAFKAALESNEVKALKDRANQAVKEALEKKN